MGFLCFQSVSIHLLLFLTVKLSRLYLLEALFIAFILLFGLFFKLKKFIRVKLLYNVVLVSTIQQDDLAIHIHISPLSQISFPFKLH